MKIFFKNHKKIILIGFFVGAILCVFLGIAFHNLGRFETSDEDLWKDTRIKQYFSGMKKGFETGDFSKTYVNDKPGVSVAILSGLALPFVPNPASQDISKKTDGKFLYQAYRVGDTEKLNFGLRVPIVVFTFFALALSAFLVYRWTNSSGITIVATMLIALNPVLLGISQIVNPDAVLWSSFLVSLLAYLVSLKTGKWSYAILAGIFFGISILSKYTGNLSILFFLILLFVSVVFVKIPNEEFVARVRKRLAQFLVVVGLGWAMFALLVPAVLFDGKLFAEGTFFAPGFQSVFWPTLAVFLILFVDAFAFRARGLFFVSMWARKWKAVTLRTLAALLLLLFLGQMLNAWTGARFVPLNDLRETIESQEGSKGNAKITLVFPMIAQGDNALTGFAKKIIVQSSYAFFTLPSGIVLLLMAGMILILVRGRVRYFGFTVFALGVPWIFFVGGLASNVLVNVRYGIVLQPIFGILAALFAWECIQIFKKQQRLFAGIVLGSALCIAQGVSLASVLPFYLNYQNGLLPQEMSFADSWSYGSYEAAMWLNAQPNAKDLVVWADRKAVCRFFVGKCLRGTTIDRSLVTPDYFVVTRRNVVKESTFQWKDSALAIRSVEEYYTEEALNHPAWELRIGGRPLNYVKILRGEQ